MTAVPAACRWRPRTEGSVPSGFDPLVHGLAHLPRRQEVPGPRAETGRYGAIHERDEG